MSCANIAAESERGRNYPTPLKTLIVGLGNPILGDDGIGWQVAMAVELKMSKNNGRYQHIEVDCFALGGLSLMERMVGYDRAIVIDAVQTENGRPGQIICLSLTDLPDLSSGHTTAVHDTSLQTALQLGREMGAVLPREVEIVGIEAEQVYEFSEDLSPAVATAIPEAVRSVMRLLTID